MLMLKGHGNIAPPKKKIKNSSSISLLASLNLHRLYLMPLLGTKTSNETVDVLGGYHIISAVVRPL